MKYLQRKCPICGRMVSRSGRAYSSHMRAHVRRGEAVEVKGRQGRYRRVKGLEVAAGE